MKFIHWFDIKSHKLAERTFLLENDLKELIQKCEFNLLVQPKVNIVGENIHGGEFLSRWIHPQLGVVSPLEFIPLLEENDLLTEFTIAISLEIITLCKELLKTNKTNLVFALNVNATSLKESDFIEHLIYVSREVKPYILEVELTEDVFMQIDSNLKENLNTLKTHNIHLALDDFGTGFSNMSYLQDLKVDTIKIDRKFISPLTRDDKSYGIVKALIDMSHAFGIKVVAEGVELTEQKDILAELGCDIIQGYLYYKPIKFSDFKIFVNR